MKGLSEGSDKSELSDLMYLAFDLYDENLGNKSVRNRIDDLFVDTNKTILKEDVTNETIVSILNMIKVHGLPLNSPEISKKITLLNQATEKLVVAIPDVHLKDVITKKLGLNQDERITGKQLSELTELDGRDNLELEEVADFTGLESAVNLQRLVVTTKKTRKIMNNWELLSKLTDIELPSSQLTDADIEKIATLPGCQIVKLNLEGNHLANSNLLESKIADKQSNEINLKNQFLSEQPLIVEERNNEYYLAVSPISTITALSSTDGLAWIPNENGNVDFSTGNLQIEWHWTNKENIPKNVSYSWGNRQNNFTGTVTVPIEQETENKTELNIKDSTIYVGERWLPQDNFISAKDREGNEVAYDKVTVADADKVDTNIPGTYKVTYTYGSLVKEATITVRAVQTALDVKDLTIYVGDKWEAKDNFVSAKDKDGKELTVKDIAVTGADKVNTAKTGTYKVIYTNAGITKTATITVKAKATPIIQYTVTFKTSTGGSLTGTTSVKVNKGAKLTILPTVKTISGYTFAGWYNGSTKVEAKNVVINANTTFTAKFTKNAPPVTKVTMFRLYNKNSGEHFYTKTAAEKNNLVKVGWKYEGIGWYAPDKGTPVYRLYNKNAGDHHYTTNVNEKNNLVKVGWKYEGVAWYSGGTKKVYRQYNPNAKSGAHNYTTNKAENDKLVKVGWRAEGIGWHAQ